MNMDAITDQGAQPSHPDESKGEQDVSFAQKLDDYLTDSYEAPKRGDIRTGVVVEIRDNGVIMDVGSKREGFVPAEDLTHLEPDAQEEIQPGAELNVYVVRTSDEDGRPVLSVHQAGLYEDWINAEEMMKSGEVYEGEVSNFNRGGLIVKFGKIRGFVPASQIAGPPKRMREEQRRQHLEAMVGQRIGLKIIEVDRQRRRLIFSQRRALRAWQEVQRERVMEELVEGETRHGRVTGLTDFGAFVDLGGADGLIHVSELSWKRVENPRQVLKVGEEIDVYILNVDHQRKRIALSLKKLQPDPWTLVDEHYQIGQLVEGRITRVLDFGAFIELDLGIEGLLHAREMMGGPEDNPSDLVKANETLLVKIIRIDSRRRRLDLSAKQVQQSEWERWAAEQQAQEVEEAEPAEEAESVQEAVADSEATPPQADAEPTQEAEPAEEAESVQEAVADSEATPPQADAEPTQEAEPAEEAESVQEAVADSEATPPQADAEPTQEAEPAEEAESAQEAPAESEATPSQADAEPTEEAEPAEEAESEAGD